MTVILVLLTFIFFLTIDWFLNRKKVVSVVTTRVTKPVPPAQRLVSGFRLPENLI